MNASRGPDGQNGTARSGATHPRVLVLSGPSAVGKSTVVRALRERLPNLHFSVSATTREPRPGEVEGVDYYFVTPERFQELIDSGELLEWAEIHGGLHRSGTPSAPVRRAADAGLPVLIEVDLAGARSVKRALPDALSVFLAPPAGRRCGSGSWAAGPRRPSAWPAGSPPPTPNWPPRGSSTPSW